MNKLTLTMARAECRAMGLTLRHDVEWNEYRVTRHGMRNDPASYHTDDLRDALYTARDMARHYALHDPARIVARILASLAHGSQHARECEEMARQIEAHIT